MEQDGGLVRGQKRESTTLAEELDPRGPAHVDEDVAISASAAAPAASGAPAAPSGDGDSTTVAGVDAADSAMDADTHTISLCRLSIEKRQIAGAVMQQLGEAYLRLGIERSDTESACMAECLMEMSAVDAKRVMSREGTQNLSLSAGVCLDLSRSERKDQPFDMTQANCADKAWMLQEKEPARLLLCSEVAGALRSISGGPCTLR